ncbi:GNAT family N-acetyltransferase [Govanella unica]|uniref:GNAT family N-acetyltransferase n=1 Tax=Govanella unica TaxID=2975056 RepID=A0A9X3TX34_9PROT|nr:hypothetical protein [Govania unica]MDA5193595.1 GNAT family N-acetyltransferase [Govania unica]
MFAKVTSAVREFGLSDGLGYLVDQLLARRGWGGYSRYLLTAQPVPVAPGKLRPGKIEIVELMAGDPRLGDLPVEPDVLRARFAQGAICLAAVEEGRAVASAWFTFGAYDEDMVRCRFVLSPAGATAWDFDIYVAPEHRMGRTFARLWDGANAELRARGVTWSMSRISAYNAGSLKSHGRMGARVIGRAAFLSLGPVQLAWASVPPFLHLSFQKGGPDLRISAPDMP